MLKMEDGDIFNIVEGYTKMNKIALILIRTLMMILMIIPLIDA